MINVSFRQSGGRLSGFTLSGHSGYGDEGTDIVCAAVTSAVRLTETTLTDVRKLSVNTKVRHSDASLSLDLPSSLSRADSEFCQAVLLGLLTYLIELRDEYPEFITVMEVQ